MLVRGGEGCVEDTIVVDILFVVGVVGVFAVVWGCGGPSVRKCTERGVRGGGGGVGGDGGDGGGT